MKLVAAFGLAGVLLALAFVAGSGRRVTAQTVPRAPQCVRGTVSLPHELETYSFNGYLNRQVELCFSWDGGPVTGNFLIGGTWSSDECTVEGAAGGQFQGTMTPVHDTRGLIAAGFSGTLADGLLSLAFRGTCGSGLAGDILFKGGKANASLEGAPWTATTVGPVLSGSIFVGALPVSMAFPVTDAELLVNLVGPVPSPLRPFVRGVLQDASPQIASAVADRMAGAKDTNTTAVVAQAVADASLTGSGDPKPPDPLAEPIAAALSAAVLAAGAAVVAGRATAVVVVASTPLPFGGVIPGPSREAVQRAEQASAEERTAVQALGQATDDLVEAVREQTPPATPAPADTSSAQPSVTPTETTTTPVDISSEPPTATSTEPPPRPTETATAGPTTVSTEPITAATEAATTPLAPPAEPPAQPPSEPPVQPAPTAPAQPVQPSAAAAAGAATQRPTTINDAFATLQQPGTIELDPASLGVTDAHGAIKLSDEVVALVPQDQRRLVSLINGAQLTGAGGTVTVNKFFIDVLTLHPQIRPDGSVDLNPTISDDATLDIPLVGEGLKALKQSAAGAVRPLEDAINSRLRDAGLRARSLKIEAGKLTIESERVTAAGTTTATTTGGPP